MSPHHPLKSPFINSSSEGELSDEYIVVGNQAKASMQTQGISTAAAGGGGGDKSKPDDTTDHHEDTTTTLVTSQFESVVTHKDKTRVQPLAIPMADDDNQNVVLSSQLEQLRKDLQSILQRLNSLENLLQRRRVRKCNTCL